MTNKEIQAENKELKKALREIELHIANDNNDVYSKLGRIFTLATTALYFNKPEDK